MVWMPLPTFMATQLKALDCSVLSTSLMLSPAPSVVVRVNSRLQNTTLPSLPLSEGAVPLPEAPFVEAAGTMGTGWPSISIHNWTVWEYVSVSGCPPVFVIELMMVHSDVTWRTRSAGEDVLIWA